MPTVTSKRKCYLLAWSPIADDPRVRRMGDALADNGWDVAALGLPGALAAPPSWPVMTPVAARETTSAIAAPGHLRALERLAGRVAGGLLAPVETALRNASSPYAAFVKNVRIRASSSSSPLSGAVRTISRRLRRNALERGMSENEKLCTRFWQLSPYLPAMKTLAEGLEGPALWLANDWWMLPIAAAGVAKSGGVIAYDSHELATEEYAELPEWVKFQKPIVAAIESSLIGQAAIVTAVSPGILGHLKRTYDIRSPAITLRNAPVYQPTAFRPVENSVRVLYHGLVRPNRGLEAAIESVPLWRHGGTLTIRGPCEPEFGRQLRLRVERLNLQQRVIFAPAEPMTELVRAARDFDIGIMSLPDLSLHMRYALPNKLFEYMMAGLALLVTDLPEMGALVRETGAGIAIPEATPEAIAHAMNGLSAERLNQMKAAALEAARQFHWDAQAAPVLSAYADLVLVKRS